MHDRARKYLALLETLELSTVGKASQYYIDLLFEELGLPKGLYPEGTYGLVEDPGRVVLMVEDFGALERLVKEHGALSEDDWNMVNATLLLEVVK